MSENIVFAPADPIDRKHRKGSKNSRSNSRSKEYKLSHKPKQQPVIGSPIRPSGRVRPSTAHPGTPPPAPRRGLEVNESRCDEDSLWYAKWWMCGFTDALRDLVPKR
jgi:hypothetical protein